MTSDARRPQRTDLPTGTVTFMFTDMEGSTRLSQQLEDGFAAIIDRHHAILRAVIDACAGVVVSTEGDAFFAVFREPMAGVTAAAEAQRALAGESWPSGVAVRVRMGLHTGAGRLGGDDHAGVDVNRAARISSAGHGGQVLVSTTTAALLAEGQARMQALVDAAGDEADPCALGRGCTALGGMHYWQGDAAEARRVYRDALEQYRACGDEAAVAGALYDLSYPVAILGDTEEAARLNDESLRIYEAIDSSSGIALVKGGQAVIATMRGHYELARELEDDVVRIRRREGKLFKLSDDLGMLVIIESRLGHQATARALLEEVLEVYEKLNDRSGLAGGLQILGMVADGDGDYETTAISAGAL